MRIPERLRDLLWHRAIDSALTRRADLVIGAPERPYLERWYVIPRNRVFNVYLHRFLRSDDDRALHDHPWVNLSILLSGRYDEHHIRQGGIHERIRREAGDLVLRGPRAAHRVELLTAPHQTGHPDVPLTCWTLFVTGPRLREWGFHCPETGWRHWRDFTDGDRGERVGRGCG